MTNSQHHDSPEAAGIPEWTFLYDCSVADIRESLVRRPAELLLDVGVGSDPSLGRFIHALGGIRYVGLEADPENILSLKRTFLQELIPFDVIQGSILQLPEFGA
jgi:hypothetical protein